jgi:DNA-binding NarL/FixJ family response regulator
MANGSAIQILLADDDPLVRQALRSALQAYPNIKVVGEANDGEEALVRVEQLRPTIVVMDINMRRMDGITATRLIKARYPEMSVVGLSAEPKDYQIYAMLKAGASEVIIKENAAVALYGAIQKAVAAVQPVLIMEETPVPKQAAEESPQGELMSKIQSTEEPETSEEGIP